MITYGHTLKEERVHIGPRPLIIAAHRLMCIHQQQQQQWRPPSVQLALCADHNASGPIGSQYYQQTPLLAHTHTEGSVSETN
jgi:hypothetical protein